jgi:hypothetical protein
MRRLFPMVGLVLVGSLSCLASENPAKTIPDHSTPSSQATCKRTSTTSAALTSLLLGELRLPKIKSLGWDMFVTVDEPNKYDDKDEGCCTIGKGTGGMTWRYETWGQCKKDADAVSDSRPEFKKGEHCR